METKADDATDFTCPPDAQLIAELEAIERVYIAEQVAEGSTAAEAEAEFGEFCQAVAQAFDQAPPTRVVIQCTGDE